MSIPCIPSPFIPSPESPTWLLAKTRRCDWWVPMWTSTSACWRINSRVRINRAYAVQLRQDLVEQVLSEESLIIWAMIFHTNTTDIAWLREATYSQASPKTPITWEANPSTSTIPCRWAINAFRIHTRVETSESSWIITMQMPRTCNPGTWKLLSIRESFSVFQSKTENGGRRFSRKNEKYQNRPNHCLCCSNYVITNFEGIACAINYMRLIRSIDKGAGNTTAHSRKFYGIR